jgi:hypothetical protein
MFARLVFFLKANSHKRHQTSEEYNFISSFSVAALAL